MPAKPLTAAQLAEAALLKSIFKSWQQQRKGNKLPWSQDWASDQMGFGQSAMNQYLNGKIPLNPEAAAKFSALTGASIESFSPAIAEEIVGLSVGVDAVLRFNSNIEPSAAGTVPTLADTLARLGKFLQRASPKTRAVVADLLGRYAQDPASGQSIAQAIELLIDAEAGEKPDA